MLCNCWLDESGDQWKYPMWSYCVWKALMEGCSKRQGKVNLGQRSSEQVCRGPDLHRALSSMSQCDRRELDRLGVQCTSHPDTHMGLTKGYRTLT